MRNRRNRSFWWIGTFSVLVIIGVATKLSSSVFGVSPGFSGSPYDGKTCATMSCHPWPDIQVSGWITTDIPASGYLPSDTYIVTLSATRSGSSRIGFQISSFNSSLFAGHFAIIDSTRTQSSTIQYVTHKKSGTTTFNGTVDWQMKWIAPADTSVTTTTFYASLLASDNGTGQQVFSTSHTVESIFANIQDLFPVKENYSFSPNPSNKRFKVCSKVGFTGTYTIALYSVNGQTIFKEIRILDGEYEIALDFSGERSGIYFFVIQEGENSHTVKVIFI